MNDEQRDPELKLVSEEWMAPPPSPQLRSRTLAAFDREFGKTPWWRNWTTALLPDRGKRVFLAATLGSAALLLMVARAFPQISGSASLPPGTKWTVDSELIRYADDGTPSVEMQMTSYKSNSNEVLISRSVPGNVFMTALGRTLDAGLPMLNRITLPLMVDPKTLERAREMRREHPGVGLISGCGGDGDAACLLLSRFSFEAGNGCIAGKIVDNSMILSHRTEAVRERWTEHGRMTIWTAPDLECFALKVTYETQQPDGSFRLVRAKQAVKVTAIP